MQHVFDPTTLHLPSPRRRIAFSWPALVSATPESTEETTHGWSSASRRYTMAGWTGLCCGELGLDTAPSNPQYPSIGISLSIFNGLSVCVISEVVHRSARNLLRFPGCVGQMRVRVQGRRDSRRGVQAGVLRCAGGGSPCSRVPWLVICRLLTVLLGRMILQWISTFSVKPSVVRFFLLRFFEVRTCSSCRWGSAIWLRLLLANLKLTCALSSEAYSQAYISEYHPREIVRHPTPYRSSTHFNGKI